MRRLLILFSLAFVLAGLAGCGGEKAPELFGKLKEIAGRATLAEDGGVPPQFIVYKLEVDEADLLTLTKEEAITLLTYFHGQIKGLEKYNQNKLELRQRGFKGVFPAYMDVEKGQDPKFTVNFAAWKMDKEYQAKKKAEKQ